MRFVQTIMLSLVLLSGCGGDAGAERARGAHEVLNTLTDGADPSYALAVSACDAREMVVVVRSGHTESEDRLDVAAIRETCDSVFVAFELVRNLQLVAREAIEAAAADEGSSEMYLAALRAAGHASEAWAALNQLLRETGLIPAETP